MFTGCSEGGRRAHPQAEGTLMGLIIIRPKPHLPREKVAEISKAIRQLPKYIRQCQEAGTPPFITFDQNEVDVFGTLGAVGCVETVATQTEIGGQMVESTELRIDITDFM